MTKLHTKLYPYCFTLQCPPLAASANPSEIPGLPGNSSNPMPNELCFFMVIGHDANPVGAIPETTPKTNSGPNPQQNPQNPNVMIVNQENMSSPYLLHLSLHQPGTEPGEARTREILSPILQRCSRFDVKAEPVAELKTPETWAPNTGSETQNSATETTETVEALASRVLTELQKYLFGQQQTFCLPLRLLGTAFQQRAWRQLLRIPYGKTVSYQEQAVACGSKHACRAVGMANHHNPLILLVPCHRVIGKNGRLTGYQPGTHYKSYFLHLEEQQVFRPEAKPLNPMPEPDAQI
ncbi:methylated-DNA--[protein]-cysteine S-methyltransferase [Candidatus Haliotispira prima]|uniref:Methylated-DNA--[protein]-cysteine S-methyltransferase n=1 Tax=Candidatus Haliotispira prima TaxID=3034016 RepID=A0ABY8MJU1_9SPIO|nr:methylated-DNA--[protein]-cysteine S-methyltransferase [Candidatus Haliotispira prima]